MVDVLFRSVGLDGAFERFRAVDEAERAIEAGEDVSGMDPEVVAKARKNVAYRERERAVAADLERTLNERIAAALPDVVRAWSHFTGPEPTSAAVLAQSFDDAPAVRAVRRFIDDDSLRFLVLLGGVGCGKTLAAMVGAWDVQARESERELRLRIASWLREGTNRGMHGSGSADERFAGEIESIQRLCRPRRQHAVWHATELATLWEPWKAEAEAGRVPGDRSRPYIILDDLGTERESERFFEAFGAFVDHRMRGSLKTVITTNLAKPDIRARYGDRIADRINHVGKAFVVGGGTRRKNGAGL